MAKFSASLVPGLNSYLVLNDPEASTASKVFAVGTDVLSVVGVGTVIKLGAKGVALGKGVVLGGKVAKGVVAAEGVAAYEIGSYNVLKARPAVRDALDIHHVGQAHAMEQIVPGYSRATGPAIALPTAEHKAIATLQGSVAMSPRSLLARDIQNLRLNTDAPNGVLQQLIELNKTMYPEAFSR